jgi:hypothetical protein
MVMNGEQNLRQVRFQHIRKTGGTTISAMLLDFFPATSGSKGEIKRRYSDVESAEKAWLKAPFLHGHADVLNHANHASFQFAFLRSPISRLLSERRQWTQANSEQIDAMPAKHAAIVHRFKNQSFSNILETVFDHPTAVRCFWNHQTLTLGLVPHLQQRTLELPVHRIAFQPVALFESAITYRQWLEDNAEKILEQAIRRLRSLDYIGIFEDFETSTKDVFGYLGLPEPKFIPHLNARGAYADEDDTKINEVCEPFINLDRVLYAEALDRRRIRRDSAVYVRSDYIGRRLSAGSTFTVMAQEPLGGHGWHLPHLRGDGQSGRWSKKLCSIGVNADTGRYQLELLIFGAATERSVLEMHVSIDGLGLPVEAGRNSDGMWWVRAIFERKVSAVIDVWISVPDAEGGYGFELHSLNFNSVSPEPTTVRTFTNA